VELVLDALTTIAWALNESDRLAAPTWERMKSDHAFVPTLWWFALGNALVVNERRGQITEQQTARFLCRVERLAITIDGAPDESSVLSLARRHRLDVYDAAYLELASRNALPLATLDAMLAAAARSEGVPLFGDDAG
jgi:predicted nucleic acid-binding protein